MKGNNAMKIASPTPLVHRPQITTYRNTRILTITESSKLNIYLRYPDGSKYFLMTHRWNPGLWALLKDEGLYVHDLFRIQPKRTRRHPNLYDSVRYILKVVSSYFEYELAA